MKRLLLIALCFSLNSCNRSNQHGVVVDETYIHRYGVAVPQDEWETRGQSSGQIVTTLKNGVVVKKSMASGILDGETTYSFPHSGMIEKSEFYSRGQLQKSLEYYHSGRPAKEMSVHPDSIEITKWYENSAPQSKETLIGDTLLSGQYFTSKNQLEASVTEGFGTRLQRDVYGQLISRDTIENGEMILSTNFYPNGAPKELIPYKSGVIYGELKTYLPGGEPNTLETWADNQKNGPTVVYENGEKFAVVPYIADIKQGIEKRFREGLELIEEICWSNNQRHGPTHIYVGDITRTDWYYQDRLVTEKTFDLLNRGKSF